MAGASDPLEDMLFSEVDEKAVSDLVGSLESQLVGQNDAATAQPENTHPGCANTHPGIAKQQAGGRAQLPASVDSPSEPTQQQQQPQQQQHGRKAAGNSDSLLKEASKDKQTKALEKENTLRSHGNIVIITTASDGAPPGNKGESQRDTRKKHPVNTRSLRGAASPSLNGNGGAAASAAASPTTSNSPPGTVTTAVTLPFPNSTTFTVSSNPQSIALDRGTPTIALQRLPRHIIASIAQNGNGTSVSALVQQAARIGEADAQVNHSKPADVKPAVNSVSSPATTSVTSSPVKPAVSVSAAPVSPVIRPVQTQTQTRPATPAQQRVVTPQLIVRPPQQQTTIQLPPGFTIPPGMVLVRTEMGQLVMVPQQALAQAQAQNSISPRPSTPTTGTTFRVTTPQSPVSAQAIRPAPVAQTKPVLSSSPNAAAQTSTATGPTAPVAAAVAMTAPQQVQPALGPQGPLTQMPLAPQSAATPVPGALVVSQEMQENVKKCKNFLATLIKLASHNSPSPETSRNVKALVQDLLDAKIDPEEFTSRLQSELKSSPQPYLVPFLKKSLPALRLSLLNSQQLLTQPLQPNKTSISPVQTGVSVRPHQPNSTTVLPQGIKRAAGPGGQIRMPVVITQTVRAAGTLGKPAAIQTCKSPVGVTIQLSGNQKNKLNDPGGSSFRDDDDINDVASMAGVNLNEESARILATNSELVGTQIRSCKDEAFLPTGLLHRRILETAKKFGVTEVPLDAVNFISHATQSRLRTVVEKVSSIAQHRMDSSKEDEWYEQSSDVRSQLKFFEYLERMEKQRKDEREREILLRAAKSRSRQEDPEQARLKQKAKEMQQQELAQMRQRDANLTALAAIGPRKKRKVDSPGATTTGTEVLGSSAVSPSGTSTPPSSSRQYSRQRITRINLRDFIFYMEQERETSRSLLLYRALLK
ncbi:transcription initiation factor TFIID subunit 4-like isoform X2 [Myxocyprinus asiaticus]|uniref:transcription initiation factor TFIID subunit 4-like isoform X2 n=1 Tax=Myxocyprinus asiaticus TaxID=70543 RepID=UPI00222224B2|nr:transcription initiation factor TFIID subunit 4-like isoform X2 [Myxocyprinus asiaticus]